MACAVIGFGAVAVSGVYGAGARHPDRPGAKDETARYFRSRGRAEWLILVVPVFGAAALADRSGGHGFTQVWVLAGLILWTVAAGLLVGVVRPAEGRIRGAEPSGVAGPARALMWASAGCDVLFVMALAFMIAQPA